MRTNEQDQEKEKEKYVSRTTVVPDTCWMQATALTASERAGRGQEIQSAQQTSVSTPCWTETALHCVTGESHHQLNQSSGWTRGGVGQWQRRVGDLKYMLIEVCLCNLCYPGLKSGTVAMESRKQTRRDPRTQASSHGAIFDQMYASATKTLYFWRFSVDSQSRSKTSPLWRRQSLRVYSWCPSKTVGRVPHLSCLAEVGRSGC